MPFRAGQDIHATTAAAIYNIPLEQVTKEMRRHAKAINFGLIYGMSAFGLTRSTELTLAEADEFVKAYFTAIPRCQKIFGWDSQAGRSRWLCGNLARPPPIFPGIAKQTKCANEKPRENAKPSMHPSRARRRIL